MRKLVEQSGITLEKHSILKNDLSDELMFQILSEEKFYKFVKTKNTMEEMLPVWETNGNPKTSHSKDS
jgi:arsenate reductase-like glutaredoxin family protein